MWPRHSIRTARNRSLPRRLAGDPDAHCVRTFVAHEEQRPPVDVGAPHATTWSRELVPCQSLIGARAAVRLPPS
jgi:hypothetical protein